MAAKKSLAAAECWDKSAASLHDRAAAVAEEFAADYRLTREERVKTEEVLSNRCQEQETLRSLEAAAEAARAERARLAALTASDLERSLRALKVIGEILADGKEEERTNVLKVADSNGNGDFAENFKNLLRGAVAQANAEADVSIPAMPEASMTLGRLTTQLGGLKDKVGKLSSVTLPEAKYRVDKLMSERDKDEKEANEVLPKLSANPKVRPSSSSPLKREGRRRLSLLPVRTKSVKKLDSPHTDFNKHRQNNKTDDASDANLATFAPSLHSASTAADVSSIDYHHQHYRRHHHNHHHSSPRKLDSISSLGQSQSAASHASLDQVSYIIMHSIRVHLDYMTQPCDIGHMTI